MYKQKIRLKNKFSLLAFFLSVSLILGASFSFYPKWEKPDAENTLGWDVVGYYMYLPATFIYKDLKTLSFFPGILDEYGFTPFYGQAYSHGDGMVLKYSSGQAVMYLPFFTIAHIYALNSEYPADGFSKPYQFMISFGSLLIAFLGLWFLRKVLLNYFSDGATAWTLIAIVFASNYLDYTAINSPMSHNYLFTLYSLLLYFTIRFHDKPSYRNAGAIGLIIGLSALTRPTEILGALIPILWAVSNLRFATIKKRFAFLGAHKSKLILATGICLLIGSLQLIYWKYVSGSWIVYSYEEEGFSWLSPFLMECFFSYRTGWLIYSPVMFFSLIGFYFLFKKDRRLFWTLSLFSFLFIYVVVSWNNWWYGGGLGLRAMIQSYPILAFPMAACFDVLLRKKILKWLLISTIILFTYYNLWLTYQAHVGGIYRAGNMTKAYFWKTVGTIEPQIENLKLLDTDDYFSGKRNNIKLLYQNDFETDTTSYNCPNLVIEGEQSLCAEPGKFTNLCEFEFKPTAPSAWIRAEATFLCEKKEWTDWKMTQMTIRLTNGENTVKERMIRIHRLIDEERPMEVYFDFEIPDQQVDKILIFINNTNTNKPIALDKFTVEYFTP